MTAHQALPSLGFSRQEYRSGLPFPSPMHACILSCLSRVRLCATPWTAAHKSPLCTEFSKQEYWSGVPFPPPTQACMLCCFSHVRLCATLWTAAHQAPLSTGFSSKNTGVGCHFLLQGIFPTQGSNSGLPHCRQTLYCLSHQGIKSFYNLSK